MEEKKCAQCGSDKELMDAKDEDENLVKICEICFNTSCEGYELV